MSAAYVLPSSAVRVPHWKHHWMFHNHLQLLPPFSHVSVSTFTLAQQGSLSRPHYSQSRCKYSVLIVFSIFLHVQWEAHPKLLHRSLACIVSKMRPLFTMMQLRHPRLAARSLRISTFLILFLVL